MAESGIEIDIGSFMDSDEFPEYDGQIGELKSSSFVDKSAILRTEVKHASTPLKVNLKMQLQKQQMEDQQYRASRAPSVSTVSSAAINMPVTVNPSDIPQKVVQVKTGLLNPTKYYLQQTRNHQIQNFISESVKSGRGMAPHSMPAPQHVEQLHSPSAFNTRQHNSSSSMPDPTSPHSVMSSSVASAGSPSEVDDLLGDILGLEQVDTSADQDLNNMLLQLSATVPHNLESGLSLPEHSTHELTSVSAPVGELAAWHKDRQKKDNHNQIERRRRYNINDRIKELGTLLPSTSDPDFRQNKGTILKASVDYIRDLKRDQQRLRQMEDKMKDQERQNRLIMLRLQQCELMLKSTGIANNPAMAAVNNDRQPPPVVKAEPVLPEAMDDDNDNPIAGDPMLSSSLTSPQTFTIDEALGHY